MEKDKKNVYSKPNIKIYGDLKKMTKKAGQYGDDGPQGSRFT